MPQRYLKITIKNKYLYLRYDWNLLAKIVIFVNNFYKQKQTFFIMKVKKITIISGIFFSVFFSFRLFKLFFINHQDKLLHFSTVFFLSSIIYNELNKKKLVFLAPILFSLVEFLPFNTFDYYDILANFVGFFCFLLVEKCMWIRILKLSSYY